MTTRWRGTVGHEVFRIAAPDTLLLKEKRPLRRQPNDCNFRSLLMLAITAGAFLLVTSVAIKALLVFIQIW